VKPVILLERSLYSTRYCFVENDYQAGVLHGMEYEVLCGWFNYLKDNEHLPIDLFGKCERYRLSRNLKPLSDSQEGGHPGWCDIMRSRLCIFTWLIANGICEVMPCACPQLFPSADILKRNQYWQRIIRKEDILYLALSASW